jgi:chloramphenicol 3-O phosphotransferase
VSRIILLNGASSAGKTTLAKEIQRQLDEPFLHVCSDQLVDMLPARRDETSPFAWWTNMRPRFFAGFHRCIAALADAGNDLVVDHIVELPAWRTELDELLAPRHDVFFVGVHCDLDELDRRELARGDRRPGEGRTHVEDDEIHAFMDYDHEVDTTSSDPTTLAAEILASWRSRRT